MKGLTSIRDLSSDEVETCDKKGVECLRGNFRIAEPDRLLLHCSTANPKILYDWFSSADRFL